MFGTDVVAVATKLASADPATCDRAGLAELVAMSQHARCWLDAFDARIAIHADRLAETGGGDTAPTVLAGGGRRGARDAAATARRGGVCSQLAGVHDALAAGTVSAGHVDAIARLAAELDDAGRAELVDLQPAIVSAAEANSVEQFDQEIRDLARIMSPDGGLSRHEQRRKQRNVRRWVDRQSGMCLTRIELDPETDARVSAALGAAIAAARTNPQTEEISFDHLKVDALVDLITGARASDARTPEITVLIDHVTLLHGLHDESVCETGDGEHLPVGVVRRMGCDAEIIPIVLGGDGIPFDHGRSRRLATREQRRALRTMYRCCGHPGCTVRFDDCRIHHVQWWEHHGPTDLANLLPLCERHHHQVHEGGWTLTMTPDRTITLRRPDGTISHHDNTTTAAPEPAATPEPPATAATGEATRPGETNIPLHLRRAARPHSTPVPTAEAEPAPMSVTNPEQATDMVPNLFDHAGVTGETTHPGMPAAPVPPADPGPAPPPTETGDGNRRQRPRRRRHRMRTPAGPAP